MDILFLSGPFFYMFSTEIEVRRGEFRAAISISTVRSNTRFAANNSLYWAAVNLSLGKPSGWSASRIGEGPGPPPSDETSKHRATVVVVHGIPAWITSHAPALAECKSSVYGCISSRSKCSQPNRRRALCRCRRSPLCPNQRNALC